MTAPKTPETMTFALLKQKVLVKSTSDLGDSSKAAIVNFVKISVRDGSFEVSGGPTAVGALKDVYIIAGVIKPDALGTAKKGDVLRYVKESGLYVVIPPATLAYALGSDKDALGISFLSQQYFPLSSKDSTTKSDAVQVTSTKAKAFKIADAETAVSSLYYTVSDASDNVLRAGTILYNSGSSQYGYSLQSYVYYVIASQPKPTPTPEVPWVKSDTVSFTIREPNKPVIYSPVEGDHFYAPFGMTFDVCGSYSAYDCRYNNTNAANWSNTSLVTVGSVMPNAMKSVTIGPLAVAGYQTFVSCAGNATYVNSEKVNYAYGTATVPFISNPVITSPVNKVYYDQTTIDLTFSVSGSFASYRCSRSLSGGAAVDLGNVNNSQSRTFAGNLTGLQLGQTYDVLVNCTAGALSAASSVPFRVEHWTGGGGGPPGGSEVPGQGGTGSGGSGGTGGGTNIWGLGAVHLGAGAGTPTPRATASLMPTVSPTVPRNRPSATMLSLDCPKILAAPTAELSASLLASGKAACDNSLTTTVTINGSINGKSTFISCSSGLHRIVVDTAQGGDYVIRSYSPAYDVAAQCVFKNGVLVQEVPEMSLLLVVLAGAGAFYAISRKKR
ncbi:Uncharacterised protein [Candidatus Norongarragalina meridionalis]|nr:Uncharacterised protein [Candidatus Norongarragalina meridionalis]